MKKLLLSVTIICFVSLNVFAAEENINLWPRLSVNDYGVDLRISNYSEDDYTCSGTITIVHESEINNYEYYTNTVYSRSNDWKYYPNRRHDDPIESARHSIYCYRL